MASGSSQTLNSKVSLPNLHARRIQRSPSLFTSLSRSKGKAAIRQLTGDQPQKPLAPVVQTIDVSREVQEGAEQTTSVPNSSDVAPPQTLPVVDIQPATPQQEQQELMTAAISFREESTSSMSIPKPISVSPRSLPKHSPNKRSWFTSSLSSSPSCSPPAPQYSPPQFPSSLPDITKDAQFERLNSPPPLSPPPTISTVNSSHAASSSTSLPISIDNSVPPLPVTPPVQLVSSPLPSSPLPASTKALNPSSSRFTLSLPLLGRAKVPSDKIVATSFQVNGELFHFYFCPCGLVRHDDIICVMPTRRSAAQFLPSSFRSLPYIIHAANSNVRAIHIWACNFHRK